jgi:L-aminopeptidase/D-esterase-like protein
MPDNSATARPGPCNLITDVPGLRVGQAEDARVITGVTVIVADAPAVCAVDVRGGGPGTRETDLLTAEAMVEGVDAITLSGGSVYGLGAADGVVAWLASQGRGFTFKGVGVTAPIVPGAILFDLANGGDKAWGLEPPYRRLGIEAVKSAGLDFILGAHGAGVGASAGAFQGGVGSASISTPDGIIVGAVVAVNSFGSVVGADGRFFAGSSEIGAEFGGLGPSTAAVKPDLWPFSKTDPQPRGNTTIACVATNVVLTKGEAKRVAIMAQDGLARAIRPLHAPVDGDVVFALSTGEAPMAEPKSFTLSRIGTLAADTLARAVARAVFEAHGRAGGPTALHDHRFKR